MWEAFLLQMNDLDLLLEHKLRRMLDPVVARRPPIRRGRQRRSDVPVLTIVPAPVELAVETITIASTSLTASAPRILS